ADHCIAQPLQRWAQQVGTAEPVIHVTMIRSELKTVCRDAFLQRSDLTVNRVIARLSLARYPRIERDTAALAHASPLRVFAIAAAISRRDALARDACRRTRRTIGHSAASLASGVRPASNSRHRCLIARNSDESTVARTRGRASGTGMDSTIRPGRLAITCTSSAR